MEVEKTLGYLDVVECNIYKGGIEKIEVLSEDLCSDEANPTFLQLRKHSLTKIGRHKKECHLVVSDPSISSVHCVIWVTQFDENSIPMFYLKDVSLNGVRINGEPLKKNVAYLLENNDMIDIWSSAFCEEMGKDQRPFLFRFVLPKPYIFASPEKEIYQRLNICKEVKKWKIGTKVIGNGTFGHVLVCYREEVRDNKKYKKKDYAVKIIRMKPNKLDKEAQILLSLRHPNIIRVHRTFQDLNNNFYIFQDLIPGGDLFSYLVKGACLSAVPESEALLIIFQILQALKYLHGKGIVHRDLKLDNILLNSPEPCTRITLADFGIAKNLTSDVKRMHTIVGTPEYCAPEVGFKADRKMYQHFSRVATKEQEETGYDKKCDLWSLGVITHIVLSGISPFYGDGTEKSVIKNAKSGVLNFDTPHWIDVSDNAKDFVKALLNVNVEKRLDSVGALDHPWISKHIDQLTKIYQKKILTEEESLGMNPTKEDDWTKKLPKLTTSVGHHISKKVNKPDHSMKMSLKRKIEAMK